MSEYRAEIDGLRAMAIVPVVLFHFGFPGFSGGFVGVDIFFVISGFLIGGILWTELSDTGRINLRHFYLRRIRRLAPAFYAMALVCFIAAWFILLPFEFSAFGRELITATTYLSNIYFWSETGYFNVLGEQRALLHTWSLAVEEQFYVVFPLLLLVLSLLRRALPWVLIGLFAASLLGCIFMTPLSQVSTFYLFPFRAWELLAGVLLAIFGRDMKFRFSVHQALSWLGLAIIGLSVVCLEPDSSFPGAEAILPVFGTFLLIANGKNKNLVNRLLTARVLLFLGGISYSLYLWHWPIFTLATYANGEELSTNVRMCLVVLSVCIAWASLRFVETPFRRGKVAPRPLFFGYIAASMATLLLGAGVIQKQGFTSRFDPALQSYIASSRDHRPDLSRCTTPTNGLFARIFICPMGPEGPPRLLIWGDSHARAFKEGLERAAAESSTPTLMVWRESCPPVAGLTKEDSINSKSDTRVCSDHNKIIAHALSEHPTLTTALLMARWTYYVEGRGVGMDEHNRVTLLAAQDADFKGAAEAELLKAGLEQTTRLANAAGVEIFVARQVPEIFHFDAFATARALALKRTTTMALKKSTATTALSELKQRNAATDAIFSELNLSIIDPWPQFCSQTHCNAIEDERAVFWDNNHITTSKAIASRGIFKPVFDAANQ